MSISSYVFLFSYLKSVCFMDRKEYIYFNKTQNFTRIMNNLGASVIHVHTHLQMKRGKLFIFMHVVCYVSFFFISFSLALIFGQVYMKKWERMWFMILRSFSKPIEHKVSDFIIVMFNKKFFSTVWRYNAERWNVYYRIICIQIDFDVLSNFRSKAFFYFVVAEKKELNKFSVYSLFQNSFLTFVILFFLLLFPHSLCCTIDINMKFL